MLNNLALIIRKHLTCCFQIGIQIQKLEPAEEGLRPRTSRTQSILNFTVNKAQTVKQSGDTGSKQLLNSSKSNKSECASSLNGDFMRNKCSSEHSVPEKLNSLDDQSEICDIGTDQSEKRVLDQSERTSLQTDQSDTSEIVGKRQRTWASENLIDDLGR